MTIINKVVDWIEKIAVGLSGVALALIMLLTSVDVVLRKTMHVSLPALYEFTGEYLMVAVVFLTLSHVYRTGGNIQVTFLSSRVAPAIMGPINQILRVSYLVFFGLIVIHGFTMAAEAWKFKEVSSSVVGYPMAPALFMVPLGAFLVCIRIIQNIVPKNDY